MIRQAVIVFQSISHVRAFIRRRPRVSAALSFGGAAGLVTHFTWSAGARWNGMVPALTAAAALSHAAGGVVMGARLIDPGRTRTAGQAVLVGAATSVVAVAAFAPVMAAWVASSDATAPSPLSYAMLIVFIGVFSFLAVGWALLITSMAVGLALHRFVRPLPPGSGD